MLAAITTNNATRKAETWSHLTSSRRTESSGGGCVRDWRSHTSREAVLAAGRRDLANPFGPPVRGWKDIAETMGRAAALYREGEAIGIERVSEYATLDLAYVVEVERLRSKLGGAEELTEFALRVTTVLRLEEGEWKIVHRHADPITAPRSAESLL